MEVRAQAKKLTETVELLMPRFRECLNDLERLKTALDALMVDLGSTPSGTVFHSLKTPEVPARTLDMNIFKEAHFMERFIGLVLVKEVPAVWNNPLRSMYSSTFLTCSVGIA